MTRYVTKGSDPWEAYREKFLADSNHNSLVGKTEHPRASKIVIETEANVTRLKRPQVKSLPSGKTGSVIGKRASSYIISRSILLLILLAV